MEYAINFGETGHLCLSTLHANNANQALTASSTSFRRTAKSTVIDLSLNLRAFVSQRLVPTVDGNARPPSRFTEHLGLRSDPQGRSPQS